MQLTSRWQGNVLGIGAPTFLARGGCVNSPKRDASFGTGFFTLGSFTQCFRQPVYNGFRPNRRETVHDRLSLCSITVAWSSLRVRPPVACLRAHVAHHRRLVWLGQTATGTWVVECQVHPGVCIRRGWRGQDGWMRACGNGQNRLLAAAKCALGGVSLTRGTWLAMLRRPTRSEFQEQAWRWV